VSIRATVHYYSSANKYRCHDPKQPEYGARPEMTNRLRGIMYTACAAVATASIPAAAETVALPDATSADFCVAVQKILANTEIEGTNEIFNNMPDYRHSKPEPNPLLIFQVVTYDEVGPVVVSCKVKSVDHLHAEYGEDSAGPQVYCPAVTNQARDQAVSELQEEDPAAAEVAAAFVIDDTEPYLMGKDYLGDFQPVYVGEDGATHIATPGLQSNWEGFMSYIMPDRFLGQTYCHLTTVDYMKRIAKGEVEPGATLTTADDAPVTPPED
jgi:hypothetical protein